jgi:A/G-specific adenine glycosylase
VSDPLRFTRLFEASGKLTPDSISEFQQIIFKHFHDNPRPMPWRETRDPYCILVSEVMLQQTQVARVVVKYAEFLAAFPTLRHLAEASLPEVLQVWQGLGYNRRALALKRCAEEVAKLHGDCLPDTVDALEKLPGIGPYTARALAAFAYDIATPLIETNIRTVFIHFFFHGQEPVADRQIMPLVALTLTHDNPREWYYALMDYGVMLKLNHPNPGRRSAHHVKQSRFEGSNRQLRSRMLQEVMNYPGISVQRLAEVLASSNDGQIEKNLVALEKEGFLEKAGSGYRIKEG